MFKFTLAATLALFVTLSAPAFAQGTNDSTAEVNVTTPDMAYHDGYHGGLPAGRTTVQTTTTSYTSTNRNSGQALMGDEVIFRPYRTYSRTIPVQPVIVRHAGMIAPLDPAEEASMEYEANLLLGDTAPAETFSEETVIIH
jgi:hypothetical protein